MLVASLRTVKACHYHLATWQQNDETLNTKSALLFRIRDARLLTIFCHIIPFNFNLSALDNKTKQLVLDMFSYYARPNHSGISFASLCELTRLSLVGVLNAERRQSFFTAQQQGIPLMDPMHFDCKIFVL